MVVVGIPGYVRTGATGAKVQLLKFRDIGTAILSREPAPNGHTRGGNTDKAHGQTVERFTPHNLG